jgi:hypothetical protein
MSAD